MLHLKNFEESKWLTERQTREALEIGKTSLWKLRVTNKLKYSKPGKMIYYLKKGVEEYLDRHSSDINHTKNPGGNEQ